MELGLTALEGALARALLASGGKITHLVLKWKKPLTQPWTQLRLRWQEKMEQSLHSTQLILDSTQAECPSSLTD